MILTNQAQSTLLQAALKKQPVGVSTPNGGNAALLARIGQSKGGAALLARIPSATSASMLRSGYMLGAGSITPVASGATLPAAGSGKTPTATPAPAPTPAPVTAPSATGGQTLKGMLAFAGLTHATSAANAPSAGAVAGATALLKRIPSGTKGITGIPVQDLPAYNQAAANIAADAAAQSQTSQNVASALEAAAQHGLQTDHPLGAADPTSPTYDLTPGAAVMTSPVPAATDSLSGLLGGNSMLLIGGAVVLLVLLSHRR